MGRLRPRRRRNLVRGFPCLAGDAPPQTTSEGKLNGRRAIVAFIVDVTARKAAEETRRRHEARFRELIERAPEPIGIIRSDRFVYANAAYVAVLGYPSAQALYDVPLSELVDPRDVPHLEARVLLLIDQGRPPPTTYRARRLDGSTVLLETSSVPFEYEGEPSILTMSRDVTERQMLQARLVQADRLAALGTMAAGVAHETNNPLAYVMLNLDWIARKLSCAASDPDAMEGLVEMLQEARGGAERVATIVHELRSFSRAEGETRRPVDLSAIVQSTIKLASHEIRSRAKITTSLERVPPVWANEGRLEQVVLNLLINAAHALVDSRRDRNEIVVGVRADGEHRVVLEVTDNGEGIPADVIARIFDPFFTTKRFARRSDHRAQRARRGQHVSRGPARDHPRRLGPADLLGEYKLACELWTPRTRSRRRRRGADRPYAA